MDTLLVIANSGRMLAQAAYKAGYKAIVVDCFADTDTQAFAYQFYQVKSLAIEDIRTLVKSLKHQCNYCVYGSGFEAYQDSLFFLSRHFQLLGNTPQIFAALHNKYDFFQRLQKLRILFPEVFFSKKTLRNSYKSSPYLLKKAFCSQGGLDIEPVKRFKLERQNKSAYYQAYLKGQAMSALFIANGKHANVLGFNTQWISSLNIQQPFAFCGIINHANLGCWQRQILKNWINQLTASYELYGLCSLDFVFYKHQCYVLEINPRPPASMQLYDSMLLNLHIQACTHKLKNFQNTQKPNNLHTAYQIVYAPRKIVISEGMNWPSNSCDLPKARTIIHKGQPICSMIATGKSPTQIRLDLHSSQQHLLLKLTEAQ